VATVDGVAVRQGTLTALSIVVPAQIVGQLAPEDSPLRGLSILAVMIGFAVGGRVAGQWALRTGATARLPSGLATGAAAYAVVQVVGIVLRLARGEAVTWLSIPTNFLLAASIGMLGAWTAKDRSVDSADGGTEPDDTGA